MFIQRFPNLSGIGQLDLDRAALPIRPGVVRTPPAVVQAPPAVANNPVRGGAGMVDISQPQPERTGVQNLQLFGGDRKTAIGTLIASGAKAENPDVGFFGDIFRKIFGGTKTKSKQISPTQTIETKVRVKNYNLEELRLSTRDGNTIRHVDFTNQNPAGGTAQVKDVGTVIAKGTVKRMFEQEITHTPGGQTKIENNYFDPKTGSNFLRTSEQTSSTETTKMGTVQSKKQGSSYRTIEVLGADGKADSRYVFNYGQSVRLENLDDQGHVTSSYNMSKKTDFFDLVDRLSLNPPSKPAVAPNFAGLSVGGGGRAGFAGRSLLKQV